VALQPLSLGLRIRRDREIRRGGFDAISDQPAMGVCRTFRRKNSSRSTAKPSSRRTRWTLRTSRRRLEAVASKDREIHGAPGLEYLQPVQTIPRSYFPRGALEYETPDSDHRRQAPRQRRQSVQSYFWSAARRLAFRDGGECGIVIPSGNLQRESRCKAGLREMAVRVDRELQDFFGFENRRSRLRGASIDSRFQVSSS